MASPSSEVIDEADDCDFSPSSPEIGMAREGESEISGCSLDDDEEAVADPGLPRTLSNLVEEHGADTGPDNHANTLPSKCQVQLSRPGNTQGISSAPDEQAAVLAPTCAPPLRSARAMNTLLYDQKYHPMDDFIRPSSAAKRRSIHGVTSGVLDNEASEDSSSDMASILGDTDSDDEDSQPPTRGQKRKRSKSPSSEPTRRSSRQRTTPKVSYNMKIHPQDSDLKRVWACDGSNSSPSPTKKVSLHADTSLRSENRPDNSQEVYESLFADSPEDSSSERSSESVQNPPILEISITEPVSEQSISPADSYQDLHPDVAYLGGNLRSWPDVKGLPFCVYTERIEDQLSAEAEAASPFHYEDDDKENDVINPEFVPTPNPLDGISIIPASHYRRSPGFHSGPAHGSIASHAFYAHPQFEASPYGLGWSDGIHDAGNSYTRDCPLTDYMSILASGENLPRASTPPEIRPCSNNPSDGSSPSRSLKEFDLRR
ncbi:hypothetical protein C7974DRAFT_70895 [Boeremia exigua]|uniref:uncharacterized protein n=1 Tax=Boeremia exigua TaxID=749465 RepID=UPI001E8D8750|nr:uncharacterized protein C7974DRAFT_70895 [Boeremia exigua]KAH6614104.1 hypothetical protein C7974DRAFT_70895 [Boeremia exigua]